MSFHSRRGANRAAALEAFKGRAARGLSQLRRHDYGLSLRAELLYKHGASMKVVIGEIKRVVVLLHSQSLKNGVVSPLAFTDVDGEQRLREQVDNHLKAGSVLVYDGPPNE